MTKLVVIYMKLVDNEALLKYFAEFQRFIMNVAIDFIRVPSEQFEFEIDKKGRRPYINVETHDHASLPSKNQIPHLTNFLSV